MKHIHKYIRDILGHKKRTNQKPKATDTLIFKCILPGCSHYIRNQFIEGKISECWECHENFVIDKIASRLQKPICQACRMKRRRTKIETPVEDMLDDILGEFSE